MMSDELPDPPAPAPALAPAGGALVVWSNAGPRMLFRKEDLVIPDSLRQHKDFHFFEKQWSAVTGFWVHRVQKEEKLQELSLPDLVQRIVDDIQHRLDKKKQETAAHKKKKRLLQGKGAQHFGTPSPHILLTNICALEDFLSQSEAEKEELVAAVVEEVAKASRSPLPLATEVLIDESDMNQQQIPPIVPSADDDGIAAKADDSDAQLPPAKARRTEGSEEPGAAATSSSIKASPVAYDERVAVVVTLPSVEAAAAAVAHLSGRTLDGRRVVVHFFDKA